MAMLEKDGRRLLSYHIVSQVGYMVAGAGIGSAMAINGAAAHAFCHIIYKALLYMGMGCSLYVIGTTKFYRLGGLYKYMPIAFWMTMVGAFSISGFPLFNGFVSKTMTIEASEIAHLPIIYFMLEGASIGTFISVGLKLPWNVWLQERDEPPAETRARLKDSPFNTPSSMLIAMGILSVLCIFFGIYPSALYKMLPLPVEEFVPYTTTRVFSILQLFIFAFLGFWIMRKGMKGHPTFVLDFDWPVRVLGKKILNFCRGPLLTIGAGLDRSIMVVAGSVTNVVKNPNIEARLTPMAIGLGTIVTLIIFSLVLIFRT